MHGRMRNFNILFIIQKNVKYFTIKKHFTFYIRHKNFKYFLLIPEKML